MYAALTQFPTERSLIVKSCVVITDFLNDKECADVISYGEPRIERAGVAGDKQDIRRCDVAFCPPEKETAWLFAKLNAMLQRVNNTFYNFDLNGYDSFQFTRYDSAEQGHYDWHMDTRLDAIVANETVIEPRKLSVTLLLNDGFKGGEFQLCLSSQSDPRTIEMPKGSMVVFPSFLLHRVTPVTEGIRYSAVVWVVGSKWR